MAFASQLCLHQWKPMPFGLCNATATFQRLMANMLAGVNQAYGNLVICYVDDVILTTEGVDQHADRLDEMLTFIAKTGLKFKPSKCSIISTSITY